MNEHNNHDLEPGTYRDPEARVTVSSGGSGFDLVADVIEDPNAEATRVSIKSVDGRWFEPMTTFAQSSLEREQAGHDNQKDKTSPFDQLKAGLAADKYDREVAEYEQLGFFISGLDRLVSEYKDSDTEGQRVEIEKELYYLSTERLRHRFNQVLEERGASFRVDLAESHD